MEKTEKEKSGKKKQTMNYGALEKCRAVLLFWTGRLSEEFLHKTDNLRRKERMSESEDLERARQRAAVVFAVRSGQITAREGARRLG